MKISLNIFFSILLFFISLKNEINAQSSKYYAFIGTKIEIKKTDPNQELDTVKSSTPRNNTDVLEQIYIPADLYECKYKILKSFDKRLIEKSIEFYHFSEFDLSFENFENILLFLSKETNLNYRFEKFEPVYKIKNNWYGIYQYSRSDDKKIETFQKLKAKNFNKDMKIKILIPDKCNENCKKDNYPTQYYKIIGKYAFPVKAFKIKDILKYQVKER